MSKLVDNAIKKLPKEIGNKMVDTLRTLAKASEEAKASDIFRDWLDTQNRFYRYSWCNSFLIMIQNPGATRVAGYKQWQKRFGRQVQKGAKAIRIWAPIIKKDVEYVDGLKVETERLIAFKVVNVFDVSDTEGKDLPELPYRTNDEEDNGLHALLMDFARSEGIAISFETNETDVMLGAANGYSTGGRVVVRANMPKGAQAATLAHEIAHELLHWKNENGAKMLPKSHERTTMELEAESVAYLVTKAFGIDQKSELYLAAFGGDQKKLQDSMGRIVRAAKKILDSTGFKQ